jgi:hypothetical protein
LQFPTTSPIFPLENRHTLTGIVGSNPTASAKLINGLVLDLG